MWKKPTMALDLISTTRLSRRSRPTSRKKLKRARSYWILAVETENTGSTCHKEHTISQLKNVGPWAKLITCSGWKVASCVLAHVQSIGCCLLPCYTTWLVHRIDNRCWNNARGYSNREVCCTCLFWDTRARRIYMTDPIYCWSTACRPTKYPRTL